MKADSKTTHVIRRYRARNRKLVAGLSALSLIVAIAVVWQFRLHGMTLTPETYCGLEEHTHTEACQDPANSRELICTAETLSVHVHTAQCYGADGALACGKADYILHYHDDQCYDSEGNLLCTLPEIGTHTHSDSCYAATETVVDPGHTHADACWAWSRGETPVCGLEESETHTHSDDCYDLIQGELLCTEEERDPVTEPGEPELVCQLPENLPHTHTAECYFMHLELGREVVICGQTEILSHQHTDACFQALYTCGIGEHTHTLQCYSDPQADLETSDVWEARFASMDFTGNWAEDLLKAAESQLGYQESSLNYTVLSDGSIRGYTRYGAWYGDAYGEWNAMFASFCLNYAHIPASYVPQSADPAAWKTALTNAGYFHTVSEALPSSGDLLFFDMDLDGVADHVGIAGAATDSNIQSIEGGLEDKVTRRDHAPDAAELLGYADISAAQELYARTQSADGTAGEEHPVVLYADDTFTTLRYDDVSLVLLGELPEGAVARAYPTQTVTDSELIPLADYHISVILPDGTPYVPTEPLTLRVNGVFDTDYLEVLHTTESGEYAHLTFVRTDTDVTFEISELGSYLIADTTGLQSVAEPGDPEAVQALVNSGYFTYWQQFLDAQSGNLSEGYTATALVPYQMMASYALEEASSQSQVVAEGGDNSSAIDEGVYISKTISGTEIENVFDITLHVTTTTSLEELQRDPDMAVVIVMDISNTMNAAFGSSTRYKAAMDAAEQFMTRFAATTSSISKIGYVAFNTDAHEILPLTACPDSATAASLMDTVRAKTGSIITDSGYSASHSRFTNIEGGLKRAYDMLASSGNENKFIIFLSDGFPTTYVSSGYNGYDPYCTSGTLGRDGVFGDMVWGGYSRYGTSYSDKAAIRAREMATTIKNSGTTIFSVGVDVAGQNIDRYLYTNSNDPETYNAWVGKLAVDGRDGYYWRLDSSGNRVPNPNRVVDRGSGVGVSVPFEIGSTTDYTAYKNWLGNSIGSGYYYDSTSEDALKDAYNKIFEEIQRYNQITSQDKWVTKDPLPLTSEEESAVEFIGFYDRQGNFLVYPSASLSGTHAEGAENTASYNEQTHIIDWDLKSSGYIGMGADNMFQYNYYLRYRVRLKNEADDFIEHATQQTNGKTTLTFQTITTVNGVSSLGETQVLEFPYPAVKGYLGELTFTKIGQDGSPVAGAEFTLTHDTGICQYCRGDYKTYVPNVLVGETVTLEEGEPDCIRVTSGADGVVTFTNIPSGHIYTLEETVVPRGFAHNGSTYRVDVAYDVVTVTETTVNGEQNIYTIGTDDMTVVNITSYVMPSTGGTGIIPYIFGGLLLMAAPLKYTLSRRRRRRRDR